MDGQPAVVADELEEVRDGVIKLNDERAGIGGLEADLLEVLKFAFVKAFGAADAVQHRRVFGSELRREHALVAEHEVLRRHRVAVGPAGVGPKFKGPSLAIRRHRPAFRHSGNGVEVDGVIVHEAFKEGVDDARLQ